MIEMRDNVTVVAGAIIALVLQIVIAPNIALYAAMPNFVVAYCLLVAIVRPQAAGPVLPFVLGLASDLCVGTPVGSTALLLTLFSFLASRAFSILNNDTVFMPLIIFMVAALLIEVATGIFMLSFGMQASFLEAFVYRALPCGLYDCVVGLVLYPLAARVLVPASPMGPGAPLEL